MIQEAVGQVGGGSATLEDLPDRERTIIGDGTTSAFSWLMVTPGRIPRSVLRGIGRNEVARLATATALLAEVEQKGRQTTLGMTGLASYLSSPDGLVTSARVKNTAGATGSLADCMAMVTDTAGLTPVGTGYRQPGVAVIYEFDGDSHDALSFVQWVAANSGDITWRVRLGDSPVGYRPLLDIGTPGNLYDWASFTAGPRTLVTADHPEALPCGGKDTRVVAGRASKSSELMGLTSHVTATPMDDAGWDAGMTETVSIDLPILHPNGLGPLGRQRLVKASQRVSNSGQLASLATSELAEWRFATGGWGIELDNPADVVHLPLGQLCLIQDIAAGVHWAYPTIVNPYAYPLGASCINPDLAIIQDRTLPFVPGVNGLYMAVSSDKHTDPWEVVDLSDWAQPVAGSVTIGRSSKKLSLTDSIRGETKV